MSIKPLQPTPRASRLLQGQGKSKEARELVQEIYGWFTEGLNAADLKGAKAFLDQLR